MPTSFNPINSEVNNRRMGFFSNLFSSRTKQADQLPELDTAKVISEIKKVEETREIPLGKKIYGFDYGNLEIRFDRDISHNGRICIFAGNERLYSFTVFAKEGEYDILEDSFELAIDFLKSDQSIKNLPDNQVLKGFYHHS